MTLKDGIERVAWTALQAFIAVLLANQADLTHLGTLKAAAIAGLAAGLSAAKNLIKANIG